MDKLYAVIQFHFNLRTWSKPSANLANAKAINLSMDEACEWLDRVMTSELPSSKDPINHFSDSDYLKFLNKRAAAVYQIVEQPYRFDDYHQAGEDIQSLYSPVIWKDGKFVDRERPMRPFITSSSRHPNADLEEQMSDH